MMLAINGLDGRRCSVVFRSFLTHFTIQRSKFTLHPSACRIEFLGKEAMGLSISKVEGRDRRNYEHRNFSFHVLFISIHEIMFGGQFSRQVLYLWPLEYPGN
jgi:hypothetical protein